MIDNEWFEKACKLMESYNEPRCLRIEMYQEGYDYIHSHIPYKIKPTEYYEYTLMFGIPILKMPFIEGVHYSQAKIIYSDGLEQIMQIMPRHNFVCREGRVYLKEVQYEKNNNI